MSKKKKKRNKPYRGQDAAAPSQPTVRRYSAVDRGKVGQWWFEKKRFIKIVSVSVGVAVVIIWLLIILIQTIAG